MERDSMIFYKSFHEATRELDPEDYKECMMALFDYAMYGAEPDLSGVRKAIFILMQPLVDKNNTRYENGKSGGRPSQKKEQDNQTETKQKPNHNQTKTKAKPNDNQTITKPEPNVDVDEDVDVNEDVEDIYTSLKTVEGDKEFAPPSREEVETECMNRGYAIDIDLFLATYKAQGWVLGNGQPVEDWKALLAKWHLSRAEEKGRRLAREPSGKKTRFKSFAQHDYDMDALRRKAKA